MKVGIYYYDKALKDLSVIYSLEEKCRRNDIQTCRFTDTSKIDQVDVLIVLGGDGTMLPAAIACGKRNIPLVGINYGHLGFLTQFEQSKALDVIDSLMANELETEKRSVLCINIDDVEYYALNEVVLQRLYDDSFHRQVIDLTASIDGKVIDHYLADGLIVCTPTGSTAYSLSAGGAILSPDLNAFMVTPICAHSLRSRPVVFSDQREIALNVGSESCADIYCDGKKVAFIEGNQNVILKKAYFTVDFLVKEDNNFYDKLFNKMNQWSGGKRNG